MSQNADLQYKLMLYYGKMLLMPEFSNTTSQEKIIYLWFSTRAPIYHCFLPPPPKLFTSGHCWFFYLYPVCLDPDLPFKSFKLSPQIYEQAFL